MNWDFDFQGDTPIYKQIRNQIVYYIQKGDLKEGDKLPSIRDVATQTGINMVTINKAYLLLREEGIVSSDRKNGTVIKNSFLTSKENKQFEKLKNVLLSLREIGLTDKAIINACDKILKDN